MLRNLILRIIIGWNIYSFIDLMISFYNNFVLFSYETPYLFKAVCAIFIDKYFENIISSSALICGTVLGYTSSRFHRVNNRLLVIYSDIFENNADYRCGRQNRSILVSQQITGVKSRKQYMWIIM
ncbi:hypothetical protein ALC62_14026 [Cyphomyrmex costatus]|uniref:Uncharacterized protein n=1 Tax=Cyphomyrmex costatus TaxID=456900 RepID=A0A151I999_9HYME|nr:hypothetical protein ALC62_14026 [Cyphomyrmex costatus]